MDRMIFVNLPVTDLARSRAFWVGLGFGIEEAYTGPDSVAVVVSPTIYLMLLTPTRFADFVVGPVAQQAHGTRAIYCLSADSPTEVDDLSAQALALGGGAWGAPLADGPMYSRSFTDPDGFVWEVMHMAMEPA